MDGFRDRMNRGSSDRFDRGDRFDESRFDRGARRGSYGAPQAQPSVSTEEIAQIIDDSNANQLNVISDFNEDTKDFIYSSNQKLQNSLDILQKAIENVANDVTKLDEKEVEVPVIEQAAPVNNECQDEILRIARDNSDLLSQLAEEQVSMLIRGNSSLLSNISESLEEKGDLIRELINLTRDQQNQQPQMTPVMPLPDTGANEEVLQTVVNNNTLLNALRAEVAGIQAEMRDSHTPNETDESGPLDATPVTKEEMDLLYRDMEDHVHKECVKVYKNVQAALEAQNGAVDASVKKGTGGLKLLVIFNLILTVINILVAVANALNIIA